MCPRRAEEKSNCAGLAKCTTLVDQNGYYGLREKGPLRLERKE